MTYKKALDLSYNAALRALLVFSIGNLFLYLFIWLLDSNLELAIIIYNILLIPIIILVYKTQLVNIEIEYKKKNKDEL